VRIYNSFQEILNATAVDVESCAMPSQLDNAARTAMRNAGIPAMPSNAVSNVSIGGDLLQKVADSVKCWEQLAEKAPEQALMELADDRSDINRALALKSRLDVDGWLQTVKEQLGRK